ncbi:hypothetical protein ACTU45_30580, partial [Streptomyces sp. 24-1644]|uniref:hypothetical protein n=1 Tax=Streptomyces sp. 24-1644 TaxID=3457315 RepID=UPI003FA694E5
MATVIRNHVGSGADDSGAAAGRVAGGTDGLLLVALGRTVVGGWEAEGAAEPALAVGEADGRADFSATVVVPGGAAGPAQPV